VGLSESLRAELAAENIFVTTVNPGPMRTGSPWRARFKGDAQAEFAWFAGIDNLPLLSISPQRIAAKIVDALQHGAPSLTSPSWARLAAGFHGALSGLSSELVSLQARLLPQGRDVNERDAAVEGREADVGQLPPPLSRAQARHASAFHED
jgi:short-subunit dehydrogenase